MYLRVILTTIFSVLIAAFASGSAQASDITLTTEDGVRLHAIYEATPRDTTNGAVLLVHDEGRSVQDWVFLTTKLTQAGFNVLALDLRHHGANKTADTPATLTDEEYQSMVQDVQAGAAYLRNKKAERIGFVGAGFGANLVMRVATSTAEPGNIVLLSPCLNTHSVNIGPDIKASDQRSILFAVSSEDRLAAKTCLVLETQARGPKYLEIYEGAGSGATMLNREPALEGLVVSWLLGINDMQIKQTKESVELKEEGSIETTGPKLPWQE